ncbi:hypothetical protein T4C_5519 [Trichinella pseudospiralis]|uniref:Uncharacterized protein n=2 Tax=Trichinella TaxID=6333 RepID=A0A0V1LZF6_9BILA|nr:hypothetical protein T4C_5519 [Trichinella pseudospiralis]KRZ64842.1 hypothetical protein T10_12936 [Trichinella papuae]
MESSVSVPEYMDTVAAYECDSSCACVVIVRR